MNRLEKEEKSILRSNLAKMGINTSPNIGLDTLRAKWKEVSSTANPETNDSNLVESKADAIAKARKEALRLVRLKIVNLDPSKKEVPGGIYSVTNGIIGTVKKYIPYHGKAAEAYHVPYCIYLALKAKTFNNISTYTDQKTGNTRTTCESVPEFSLTELPPLTQEELDKLALEQAAAESIDK